MELLILLVLFILNGVFAMSEMAVVSSRKARLQQLTDDGRPGAAAALSLANEPSRFLSTIQVGITLIGITSGAFGEATLSGELAAWLGRWPSLAPHADVLSVALVIAGITAASLLIGELVPKRLALLNPELIASLVARPMQFLSRLAHPVVWLLSMTTELILGLLGLRRMRRPPVTEEEIEVLMEQGARAGVFEQHEQTLVSRAFRFDHIKVGAIMTPRTDIVRLDLDEPVEASARTIMSHAHSRFLVVRGGLDRIEGVVLARSLLADAIAGKPLDIAAHLAAPLYVPTRISALELMRLFRRHRQTIAVAVNEHGAAEGLVTLNDVLGALVGDIASEDFEPDPDLVRRDDGSWLVDGAVSIERLRDTLGIDEEFPGEEGGYHTAAGFMMEQLGRVPAVGDNFEWLGWRWEVLDMDERRVDRILAVPPERAS